jgi:parallel beta-helix repeat protein
MRNSNFSLSLLVLTGLTPLAYAATVYVAPNGNDANSGAPDKPVATLSRGRDLLRGANGEKKLVVRAGTYFQVAPLQLTGEDAGLQIVGENRPVISGGREIKGWTKADGNLWKAPVAAGWDFRMMRAGDEPQILARTPNFDAAHPTTGGWKLVAKPAMETVGAFGASLGRIHTPGDWMEWKINVPAAGDYALWFYYGAENKPFGNESMAGRTQMQIDGGAPLVLQGLPDTKGWGDLQWSKTAVLPLTQGEHILRWTNVKGGGLTFDAFALSDDANWTPQGRDLKSAVGKNLIVVQAEAFSKAQSKEMSQPEEVAPAFTDHFTFKPGDITAYPRSTDPQIHIFPAWGWVSTILQVDKIDTAKNEVWVKRNSSASQELRVGNRYYVANIFEGLDSPGEFWHDKKNNTVYWWPKTPEDVKKLTVAPVANRLIEITGAEKVSIKGFEFRDTNYSLDVGVYDPQDTTINLSNAKNCVIENNRFIGVGGYAARLENKSAGNEFVGNEVGYAGQGGVIMVGDNATQPKNTLIAGNWMHHLGQVYKHVAGAYCTTASGTKVSHNRFEFLPRYAISFKAYNATAGSHDCIAEYNEILQTNLETNDTGAIEMLGRDKANSGNVFQYNKILDVVGLKAMPDGTFASPFMTWGIYLDDYSSGTTIRGNLVARHEWGGASIHGGQNNVVENNIFVNGGVHQMWYDPIDDFCINNRFTKNILVYKAPDADLIKQTRRPPQQTMSLSDANLFWHTQGADFFRDKKLTPLGNLAQWQAGGFDQNSIVADPLFVDAAHDDYRLKPASPALNLGFTPLPFDKMGLNGYERAWKIPAVK